MSDLHQRWPQQECLHANTSGQEHIMSPAGLVQVIPSYCYDCGYEAPVDEALFPVWDDE